MQDLFLIKDNIVIIQSNDKIYQDTKDNFLKDCDLEILHDNVDYNKDVKRCLIDNVLIQEYPISIYENVINNIDDILDKKAKREYIEPTREELEIEAIEQEVRELDAQISDIKDRLMFAILTNDSELIDSLREEYKELLSYE